MKPMLAQPLEIGLEKHARQWARVVENGYYMEPKLDGMRVLLHWDAEGGFQATTRSGRDITPHLTPWSKHVHGISPGIYDCEIGYQTEWMVLDFNRTMRVLGSGPEVAVDKWKANSKEGHELVAYCFDFVSNLPQYERNRRLVDRLDLHPSTPIIRIRDAGPWNQSWYEWFVERGGEGVILKNPYAHYVLGGRPTQTWYKVKKFNTADAVIVDVDWGKGKYMGDVGALVFQLEDGLIGRCSGMDDEERRDMTRQYHDDTLLGKWIEIRFFGGVGRDKEGIRHPQFIRFRDDK